MIGVFVQTNLHSRHRNHWPVGFVVTESGCWEWVGATIAGGYGRASIPGGGQILAHRMMWERERGPIPDGMDLDHICRNRRCVRPAHLEVVSHRENVRRGFAAVSRPASPLRCMRGHDLTGRNLYTRPNGTHECRACIRRRDRAAYYADRHHRRADGRPRKHRRIPTEESV